MIRTPKTGIVIVIIIASYVVASLWTLLSYSSLANFSELITDSYYLHVAKFSFYQATLSTGLSVGLALPVAHALSRRRFLGRNYLLKVFGTTLVLPVLVGVFGILSVYGNQGVVAQLLGLFNTTLPFSIYGLNGILIAHVFFNLPFATRLLLMTIESVPSEQRKLAKHLGMGSWSCFKFVEWPRLKQHLPHVVGLVFMLCFTSFATVMALGGGPKATTIELAIYQAIKFDFDLQVGAVLAMWQMGICSVLVLLVGRFSKVLDGASTFSHATPIQSSDTWSKRLWDSFWIIASLLLVTPPLLMVVLSGLNHKVYEVLTDAIFWQSLISSLQVAMLSAVIAAIAGILILSSTRMLRLKAQSRLADKIELVGTVILVTPALVISTATFLMLRGLTDVFSLAVVIVVLVNALMALPFVIKTLSQPMLQLATQYHLLWRSLGILGVARFFSMEWRALRAPLMHAFSMSFILSLGDLTVIALFGSQDFKTLPLYLYQLLGSYQMQAAAVVSLVLFTISIGMFSLTDRLVVKNRHRESQ
ncbi:thiamine/thiamine pyrophosphate ABC transporter permease [Vibrio methylphosphonaticus]|uniref:thiamine/thiamine pyrophosphate ABC transporter permease n=1 Tax=Vibrio methylphosphonaticus TaxID=2946866 RepID=UPI00202A1549|nr:thiamine/thiamine pyrophosphate ABC transporter permease [Vibrio methylphosphonaticus]MCL9777074.1 thiamine/thiamine pyrophosphate ABC transporter permease [Vibrio methylphosphonaticus]